MGSIICARRASLFRAVAVLAATVATSGSVLIAGTTAAAAASAPDAPIVLSVVAGLKQAVVSWGVPNDNGSPIQSYAVTVSPGDQTTPVYGPQTSVTVYGLTQGTAYNFTVTATNEFGTSSPSAPSPATTGVFGCGITLNESWTLTQDLSCPGTALVVDGTDASPVVLDLGGHTVTSTSPEPVLGCYGGAICVGPQATLQDGTVDGGVANSTNENTFQDLTFIDGGLSLEPAGGVPLVRANHFLGGSGIYSSQANPIIEDNVFQGPGSFAMHLKQSYATVMSNTVSGYDTGLFVADDTSGAIVENNVFDHNGTGIQIGGYGLTDTGGHISNNRVMFNTGDGILIGLGPGTYPPGIGFPITGNVVLANGGDGIHVTPLFDGAQGLNTTLANNVTIGNAGLGINALNSSPPDIVVTDGGGNQASENGNPEECVNVSCAPFVDSDVVSVGASPLESVIGQTVTLTATASSVTTPDALLAGTMRFYDGATLLHSQAVTAGVASFSTAKLAVGAHAITATFTRKGSATVESSTAITEQVDPAVTVTAVASDLNPAIDTQKVTLRATVTRSGAATGTVAGGTVTFLDGTTVLGSKPVSRGAASFATKLLDAGTHPITAAYSGSVADEASTSGELDQTVTPAATSITLTAAPNPVSHTRTVALRATVKRVAPAKGQAGGTVTFYDQGVPIGTVPLSAGKASLTLSGLTVGSHPITADYNNDPNDMAVTTAMPLTVTVT